MSLKDLELQFSSLQNVFTDLTSKIDTLINNYANLEKRYEKCVHKNKKKKSSFKCQKCGEELETVKDLQEHTSCVESFECDECDKCFQEESKLEEHVHRNHKKYPCDDCEKIFNFEGLLEKHKSAAHEDFVLYCHFFNNDKDCPYEDQCVFVHEDSEDCMFAKGCERKLCMYKHEERDEDDDEDESEDESDMDEDEDENQKAVENLKPSLEKVKEALEKVTNILKKVSPTLKCNICDFEAKNQNGLTMHNKAKHTNK